jgi:hypothetical protein
VWVVVTAGGLEREPFSGYFLRGSVPLTGRLFDFRSPRAIAVLTEAPAEVRYDERDAGSIERKHLVYFASKMLVIALILETQCENNAHELEARQDEQKKNPGHACGGCSA